MILIGAGFHGHVDDRGARLSNLRGVVAGLEGDFLNRVRVRLGHLRVNVVPEDLRGGVLAFDAHRLGERNSEAVIRLRATQTVDHHRSANCATCVITGHTGKGLEHIVRVAYAGRAGVDGPDAQQRRIYHLLDRDVVAQLAGFGLQQR